MSNPIKFAVIIDFKGEFTKDFYCDIANAYDDLQSAQKDILNGSIERPLSIISINTTTGEVYTVMKYSQIQIMLDEKDRAKEQEQQLDLEDAIYGTYTQQHARAMRGAL